ISQVKEARRQLAPDQIGKHGQLQEWLTDIDKPNNNHRHMSPLWCLYPGAQVFRPDPPIAPGAIREGEAPSEPPPVPPAGSLQRPGLPDSTREPTSPPFPPDPRLYNAAKVLLDWRGDGSTGWSYAWRMNLRARTGEGDAAFKQFESLLGKRTLPNLFDLC